MVEGGGGDHLPPSGDLNLFDPDAEGKLQGTGSLHERLKLGADFGRYKRPMASICWTGTSRRKIETRTS